MPGSLLFKLFKRNPSGGLLAVSQEIVWSGGLALARTVHGMDAVAEPTGTYLRRVLASASPPLSPISIKTP
ncbi:hypothetical protein DBR20_05470 [Stenotrophomonas sp. HMWF023]|nr:hypothetical protein DBR20_05470 [Stenotrophomonas sp. HMWF023]